MKALVLVERPSQVLFMTYEEVSTDTVGQLRRLTDFVGRPFTAEERAAGVDDAIARECSMKSLAGTEVNRSGKMDVFDVAVPNRVFFRRGVVGDWSNHLTLETAKKIDEITGREFRGSGLAFP